jgi:hypothetical protein
MIREIVLVLVGVILVAAIVVILWYAVDRTGVLQR